MYLTHEKVQEGLKCSREILKDPRVFGARRDYIPISIEAIQDVIVERTKINVQKWKVIYENPQYIRGRIERTKGNAKIHIRAEQDDFWKRLAAAKELFHIIVDKDVDLCPYGDEILDELVLEGHCGILVTNGNGSPKQSELIAELAAQETLYPWELRQEDLALLGKKETSIGKLALKYQIPEGTASTLLNPRYIQLIQKALAS